ncbi:MAG TPA: acetate/propionate family kinase [Candidatus Angelobacter sp.]|nr:acetate/propionate family kinase [Candidatus Angelobacter sp.]
MEKTILTLNGGSSSLKFALYHVDESREEAVAAGAAEGIGTEQGRFWLRKADKKTLGLRESFAEHSAAARVMFARLKEQGFTNFSAVGHRVVHGGRDLLLPQRVDSVLISRLKALVLFAPLHLPEQIALMEAVAQHYPDLPQVACFDTAFHAAMPEIARRFALPRKLWDEGVMRYGFHGLSYEYVVSTLGSQLGERAIVAHLGNGASMVALKDGAPVDTSMGLTPTGGFMMGTRSGDLDPGVLLYLLRTGRTTEDLAQLLDHESGLLGVSGLSSEMKTLLDRSREDPNAGQAVAMFCYQIRKFIGAYSAVLGGLDALVFTGGIGERAAEVRASIVGGLEFLGIELDDAANAGHASLISTQISTQIATQRSRCQVWVVKTDEDLMIARHTRRVISL